MKKKILYVVKLITTLGLVLYFLDHINLRESLAVLKKTNLPIFFAAILITAISWYLSAIRWRAVLGVMSVKIPAAKLFFINLIGTFYGIVLPGGKLSGDAISAHRFTKSYGGEAYNKKYFFSALVDRIMGLLTIAVFLSLYFLAHRPIIKILGDQTMLLGFIVIALTVIGILGLFSHVFDSIFFKIIHFKNFLKEKTKSNLESSIKEFRAKKKELGFLIFISAISMFFSVLSVYAMSSAVGLNLSLEITAFAYFLSALFIILPLTIAGVGVREGVLVFVLTRAGFKESGAIALAVVGVIMLFVFALIGAILELWGRLKKTPQS